MHKAGKRRRPWLALLLEGMLCAAPFAALPWALYHVPEAAMEAGLFILLWVCCPILSFFLPAWAARRGVPALVACVLPVSGYLLVLAYHMEPVLGVLLASLVLSIVSASYGQERLKRAQEPTRK